MMKKSIKSLASIALISSSVSFCFWGTAPKEEKAVDATAQVFFQGTIKNEDDLRRAEQSVQLYEQLMNNNRANIDALDAQIALYIKDTQRFEDLQKELNDTRLEMTKNCKSNIPFDWDACKEFKVQLDRTADKETELFKEREKFISVVNEKIRVEHLQMRTWYDKQDELKKQIAAFNEENATMAENDRLD